MSENIEGSATETAHKTYDAAADKARKTYDAARDKAQQVMGQARERASEYYQQGKEKAADYTGRVEDMVREQPIKSVLIAIGAGLLLGMLFRRK